MAKPRSSVGWFGSTLREYRAAANLTREELAERAGLSVHAIGMLERGVRRLPRPGTVELLAWALRLDPSQRAVLVAAARYVHEHRDSYPDGVFWVRAEEESGLVGDLAGLVWRLGLPEQVAPERERRIAAVLRWLCEHPRWLLVLDNLEPAAAEARGRWLPSGLPGHVLVTSRTPLPPPHLRLESFPRRYSLAERQGDGLRVHRIVQAIVRSSLPPEEYRAWLATAVRLLAPSFRDDVDEYPQLWPQRARLLPHARAVEELTAACPVEPAALTALLTGVGGYLWSQADYEAADPVVVRAAKTGQEVLGPGHPLSLQAVQLLGLPRTPASVRRTGVRYHRRVRRLSSRSTPVSPRHEASDPVPRFRPPKACSIVSINVSNSIGQSLSIYSVGGTRRRVFSSPYTRREFDGGGLLPTDNDHTVTTGQNGSPA